MKDVKKMEIQATSGQHQLRRVLLVDDDEDDYLLARELFDDFERDDSYELEWVSTFELGLQALGENRHDICLLDYRLGAQDGIELLREALERGCRIPIVLLTGAGNRDVDYAAMRYGAADYLVKSDLTPTLLERSIRYSLENARLYQQAQRAIELRDEVHRIVVHDLRNPLSTMGLAIQLMERAVGKDRPAADFAEHLQTQRLSIKRMNRLIEDLLDVARIENGKLSISQGAALPEELIAAALDQHRIQADDRGIELMSSPEIESSDLPYALADIRRIEQVLANLIGNSLKFTPEGGRVEIGAEKVDDEVVFAVIDNGYGISEEQLPHLFDRFWQAQQGSANGAGLGLAICKGIIEAHDGRIWAESEEGSGTTFYFTVPIYRES